MLGTNDRIVAGAAATGFERWIGHVQQACPADLAEELSDVPSPGEIAPMSFLTYQDVRPWRKRSSRGRQAADASLVRDPAYGHFANDKRLTTRKS